ncbi:MAG TPA: hypothetical protein VI216_15145 [Candidatus Acidoferrales bacterium]
MTTKQLNESQVKVQTGTYAPVESMLKAAPLTPAPPTLDRRRGQRVLLRVRASIHVALKGQPETFSVATLSVNPHGAMVLMDRNLAPDTRLVLEHAATKERVACKVVRSAQKMPEGFHVPLEFDSPAPDFWKIDFPSPDWRPNET